MFFGGVFPGKNSQCIPGCFDIWLQQPPAEFTWSSMHCLFSGQEHYNTGYSAVIKKKNHFVVKWLQYAQSLVWSFKIVNVLLYLHLMLNVNHFAYLHVNICLDFVWNKQNGKSLKFTGFQDYHISYFNWRLLHNGAVLNTVTVPILAFAAQPRGWTFFVLPLVFQYAFSGAYWRLYRPVVV